MRDIKPLIAFVEEINHAMHARRCNSGAARAPAREEEYASNLELQGQVDTYLVLLLFVAFFRKPGRVTRADRRWLRFHMFQSHTGEGYRDKRLRARYAETTVLAASYTKYLESLAASRRVDEIRVFHALGYGEKRARILSLTDRGDAV